MSIAIGRPVIRKTDRLFFSGMALASVVILFLGFLPSYFHRSADLPPLTPLYQLHGAVFTAWIVLLVAQTALVAQSRSDIHRKLGVAGAVLAAVVFVVGVAVSVETLRREGGVRFFAIPLGDIIVFGVLVGAAVLQRQQSDTHKRLMLARDDLASDRGRRTIFGAGRHGRATEPVLRHRCLGLGARHLRSRLAWAGASGDPLGWRDGGRLEAAAVLRRDRHDTVARSYRRFAYLAKSPSPLSSPRKPRCGAR